ncbi:PREDICTED: uncharacterized protein LOC109584343 [Amphimedon queenslandica]|uniref:Uncharacterized protein n=1 Tax=Amphimedon queenslandica TaxID=400682 RepID=A0AAN0JFN6_AMPQE|nr:PREDICTED: uncharacterized protein LOC109584343 [Amphimedon queenslandica]|eukprot:XP_019855602.1 PREDICTED: uncharacterized protein LOC109584343 [Amphimedon queenslandica]
MNLPETYVSSNTLRVLQEYQFNCSSTNITSLILGINIREATGSRNFYPSVQVFRPNGSLVTGSERTIYYSTSNVSTSGVFEYPLNPPIPVMSGDLIAVSQRGQASSAVRVYYISGITANSQEFSYGNTYVDLNKSQITNQLILVYPVTDGYCVNSANSINASFIKEKALEVQRPQVFYLQHQFIYPWIVFSCNGSVTKWIFGAKNNGNTPIQSEFQIWRQLGPNNYNKIGSSLVNANTMIGTNLYEFIPQTPLQFQEGDIFGVYSYKIDGERLVLYEQRESGPTNLRINSNLNSPPLKITEVLATTNNDFPLITVEISVSTDSVLVTTSSVENSPVISITSFPSIINSPPSTESFHSQSSYLQTLNIVSQSMGYIDISSSQVLMNSSETLIPTSTQTNNAITSITTTTSTASTSGSDRVSFMTTTDGTLLSTSSSNVIGNPASNTSGSITIIIAAVSSLLLLVAVGLVVSLLVVITACRIKRKKSRGIDSVSQDRDSGLNNPTYGDNCYANTKHNLCINSKERSCSYEITNDVYGEQELVGSLNPLLPTNDGISNTLMTLEMNDVLYGNNETEGLYSEAVAAPTSALVSIQNPINISS